MKKIDNTSKKNKPAAIKVKKKPNKPVPKGMSSIDALTKPTSAFTRTLAREIVKNLSTIGVITSQRFKRKKSNKNRSKKDRFGTNPMLIDTSVLIDGRILPIVNSNFISGTLIIPDIVLKEIQYIADSSDTIRRTKGRRGLEVVTKLKKQKTNRNIIVKIIDNNPKRIKEVDHKLVEIAKTDKMSLITIDYNLAQLARAKGLKVLNIMDLAQAMKVALVPREEVSLKITHVGKDQTQGVGHMD